MNRPHPRPAAATHRAVFAPALLISLACAAAPPARASVDSPLLVSVRVEYYDVAAPAVHDLVSGPTSDTDATGLRDAILKQVEAGEATQVESSYVVTRSGQRAKSESVCEWIYAVGFNPPAFTQELTGPIAAGVEVVRPATATAFETRNVGHTLEVDPVISADGSTIDLNLAPEIVTVVGTHRTGSGAAAVDHPVFFSARSSQAVSLQSGDWVLLGSYPFPPPKPDARSPRDRRFVGLVRADVLRAGNETSDAAWRGAIAADSPPTDDDPFAADPNPGPAEARAADRRLQVGVLYEWFELDAMAATRLLDAASATWADATPIRDQVLELVDGGDATLAESAYVVTRSGQRAKSEAVSGITHVGEVTVGGRPSKLTGPIDPATEVSSPASPSAFNLRNVGTTLEVDPVIGAAGLGIDINLAPEITSLVGKTGGSRHGATEVEHPLFHTVKTSTAAHVPDGTCVLLGMASPAPPDATGRQIGSDRRVIGILTTRLLEVD